MSADDSKEQIDEDGAVTMQELLDEEEELEETANAVLGDSDDKNCTYPKGYLGRQALYACKTCCGDGHEPAGVCLACSYECHEGHELVELYTKRNFRCDCGNEKFSDNVCRLYPNKEGNNSENHYNQNFVGLYCTCGRPYPDAEDHEPDQMIQCVGCEDWFHGRHLMADIPDDFEEMICQICVSKYSFLLSYAVDNADPVKITKSETMDLIDVCSGGDGSHSKTDVSVETNLPDVPKLNGDISVDQSQQTTSMRVDVSTASTEAEQCSREHVNASIGADLPIDAVQRTRNSATATVNREQQVTANQVDVAMVTDEPVAVETSQRSQQTGQEVCGSVEQGQQTGVTQSNVSVETTSNVSMETSHRGQQTDVKNTHVATETAAGNGHCSQSDAAVATEEAIATDVTQRSQQTESNRTDACTATTSKSSQGDGRCLLQALGPSTTFKDTAIFWQAGWRQKLCRCPACMDLYRKHRVMFLLDETDTVQAYEERGAVKRSDSAQGAIDPSMALLQGMDRIQQIEMIHGYNDLKSELKEYLKKFAENKKVVREEDIREFFEVLSNKRRRLDMPPNNCR